MVSLQATYRSQESLVLELRASGLSYAAIARELRDRGNPWAKQGGVASFLRERRRRLSTPPKPRRQRVVALDPYLQEIRALRGRGLTYGQIGKVLQGRPGLTLRDVHQERIRYFLVTRNSREDPALPGQPGRQPTPPPYVPRRPRSRLTPYTEEILKALREGVSMRSVARQHGVTIMAIHGFLRTRERRLAYEAIWGSVAPRDGPGA